MKRVMMMSLVCIGLCCVVEGLIAKAKTINVYNRCGKQLKVHSYSSMGSTLKKTEIPNNRKYTFKLFGFLPGDGIEDVKFFYNKWVSAKHQLHKNKPFKKEAYTLKIIKTNGKVQWAWG